MFKGPKPSGQPRTLRTIAEEKNSSGSFMQPPTVEVPAYADPAASAQPIPGRGVTVADPKPFNVKGG